MVDDPFHSQSNTILPPSTSAGPASAVPLNVAAAGGIAIARALLGEPRILVLDEATSALDYESERVVRENLRAMARGRTVLIIAHRLAAVRDADGILVVERGQVVEDGTHEALVRTGARYAGLWRHQVGVAHEKR